MFSVSLVFVSDCCWDWIACRAIRFSIISDLDVLGGFDVIVGLSKFVGASIDFGALEFSALIFGRNF